LHSAVAPAGAPAGARTVGTCDDGAVVVAGATLLVDRLVAVLGVVERGALEVGGVVCLVEAVDLVVVAGRVDVVRVVGFLVVIKLATPP
jgi:hypothetical protein